MAWLSGLITKILTIELNAIIGRLTAFLLKFFKDKKKEVERKKEQAEELVKYQESVDSNKTHEEKVKDAKNFLNNISKP